MRTLCDQSGQIIFFDSATWREELHSRVPKGTTGGGRFTHSVNITGNELGDYTNKAKEDFTDKDMKKLRDEAKDYFQKYYQKASSKALPSASYAYREDVGEIQFTKRGIDETIAWSADPDKLLLIPFLKQIIETGKLGKSESGTHLRQRKGQAVLLDVTFYPITKTVNFKGESRDVEVLIWQDKQGHFYYDLFLDGSRQKKKSPTSLLESKSRHVGDSSNIVEDNISDYFWNVNIKFI